MSKLVTNYTYNGSSTTDEYGTFIVLNRLITGDVIEGFQVVANGTPNMTVLVNPGSGRISTGTYPSSYGYLISHDTVGGESVTIATASASPRIDYVVAYIDRIVVGSTSPTYVNNTNNVLKFASVQGTPAGSPNPPTVGQIQSAISASNPYIILAQVAVGTGVSSITNPNITDVRTFVAPISGRTRGMMNYVDSGLSWSTLSGLNGTMTAGTVYINVSGIFVQANIASIASHAFAASSDTYVSVDYTGTISYNATSNGGAVPTISSTSVFLALVVTNGSAITSITDIAPRSTTQRRVGIAKQNTTGTLVTNTYAVYLTVKGSSSGREVEANFAGFIGNANSGSNRTVNFKVQCDGVDLTPKDINMFMPYYSGFTTDTPFNFTVSSTPSAGYHVWTFLVVASAGSAVVLEQCILKITEV